MKTLKEVRDEIHFGKSNTNFPDEAKVDATLIKSINDKLAKLPWSFFRFGSNKKKMVLPKSCDPKVG